MYAVLRYVTNANSGGSGTSNALDKFALVTLVGNICRTWAK